MKRIVVLVSIIGLMIVSLAIGMKGKSNLIQLDDGTALAVMVNGSESASIPSQTGANYEVTVSCANGTGRWDYENWKLVITDIDGNTRCSLAFDTTTPEALNTYIARLGESAGVYNQPVGSTDKRYAGKTVDNYVWFNNELWRIIGVFDEKTHGVTGKQLVKIIKAHSQWGLAWQTSGSVTWGNSTLKALLNGDYLNGTVSTTGTYGNSQQNCYWYSTSTPGRCDFDKTGIKSRYKTLIDADIKWYVGLTGATTNPPITFYKNERGITNVGDAPTAANVVAAEGVPASIGLMYPSDYAYSIVYDATNCNHDTKEMNTYNTNACAGSSWLYDNNSSEWTITSNSTTTTQSFYVYYPGYLYSTNAYNGYAVRPVLYLTADTMKYAGNGTYENPYIIVK